jgi:hypothetical protein
MLRDLCLALALRGNVVSVIAQDAARLDALRVEAERHGKVIHPLPVDYGHAVQLSNRIRAATALHGPISLAVCWVHGDSPQALPTIAEELRRGASGIGHRASDEKSERGEEEGVGAHTHPHTHVDPAGAAKPPKKKRGEVDNRPRLFHLIGSMSTRPEARAAIEKYAQSVPEIAWRRVLLGFKFMKAAGVEPGGAGSGAGGGVGGGASSGTGSALGRTPGGSRWLTHEEIWQGTLAAIENDWTESVIGVVTPWAKRPG